MAIQHYNATMNVSSKLQLSPTTAKLFHLKQFAIGTYMVILGMIYRYIEESSIMTV